MTQPPSGDQPQHGAQPDPQPPPPYGGQPPQYGGGQPPQYGGGQPPQYGGQPGYGGGEGEPPKNKKTGLIIGLVVLAVIVIGIVIALGTLSGGSSSGTSGETFCDRFEKNAKSNQFDNIDPADTDKLINELKTFKDLAPEELKDDYDQLINAANGNPGANIDTAVQNIQNYAVDNCDVQLDTPPS